MATTGSCADRLALRGDLKTICDRFDFWRSRILELTGPFCESVLSGLHPKRPRNPDNVGRPQNRRLTHCPLCPSLRQVAPAPSELAKNRPSSGGCRVAQNEFWAMPRRGESHALLWTRVGGSFRFAFDHLGGSNRRHKVVGVHGKAASLRGGLNAGKGGAGPERPPGATRVHHVRLGCGAYTTSRHILSCTPRDAEEICLR